MKELQEIRGIIKSHMDVLTGQYHVGKIGIFGSFLHGAQNEDSDLDVLVQFSETVSLIELIRLEEYLDEILDLKVDLVLEEGIKPALEDIILQEVVYI